MSKKWYSGPPPSIGWRPANRVTFFNDVLRWWDGSNWSRAVVDTEDEIAAGLIAKQVAPKQIGIRWQKRPKSWPAHSHT